MQNPELKKVLPYIPYGVQAKDEHGNLRTVTIDHQSYDQNTVGINHVLRNGLFFKRHTLVLRPLSDLTNEIEHNGEKFVPIIELFKMRTQQLSDSIDKIYIETDTAILKLQKNTHPDGTIYYCDFFEIDIEPENIRFSLVTEYYQNGTNEKLKEEFYFIGNEFNMLQKLLEWHFDIYGLIEEGLVVQKT